MLLEKTPLFLLPCVPSFGLLLGLICQALVELHAACLIVFCLCTALVIKIQEAGSKDDIKVPLRVLRDEIGRAFFSGWVLPNQPLKLIQ